MNLRPEGEDQSVSWCLLAKERGRGDRGVQHRLGPNDKSFVFRGPLRLQGIAVALPLDRCEPTTSSSATFTVSPSSVSSSVDRHPLRPVVKRPTAACSSSGSNLNLLIP
nr:hypothetical protein Iba_chr05bCG2740 [Ipomoea batatas]